jgi:DNA-directed RNA polymerase subunit RPC12/RpoP
MSEHEHDFICLKCGNDFTVDIDLEDPDDDYLICPVCMYEGEIDQFE